MRGRHPAPAVRRASLAALLALAGTLGAQEAPGFDLGPPATRNLDPFLTATLVYQPESPFLTGVGRWRVSYQEVEANILDVPRAYAGMTPYGLNDRKVMSESFYAAMAGGPAPWYSNFPFLYYIQEETTRGSLEVRTGIGAGTDLWVRINAEMHSGGILDGFTEAIHRIIHTNQWARLYVARNQTVFAMSSYGKVLFYTQGYEPPKFQDPELGLVQRLGGGASSGLDLALTVKAPMTKAYNYFEGGWDAQAGLTGYYRNGTSTFFYGGGYTHRGPGNAAYQGLDMTGNLAAHLGWQGRTNRKWQPFYQLYWMTGYAGLMAQATLHRTALQQDLGVHWFPNPRLAWTLHYVGHIAQSGNTDDYQLNFGVTGRF